MNFQHYDLSHKSRGEIVEVTLTAAANVRLMDTSNFNSYRNGRNHRYHGGLVRRSPFRIAIPRSGRWHLAVDMSGLRGSTRIGVRILPGALPEAREAPFSSVPTLIREPPPDAFQPGTEAYDVFISHASEDKDDIVRPLANALGEYGLKVRYDEFELRIGDSLRRKIDRGLTSSRFGIVVLSEPFFNKGWTTYELDGTLPDLSAASSSCFRFGTKYRRLT